MPKTTKQFIEAVRDQTGIEDGCPVCGGLLEGWECWDCGADFTVEAKQEF